MAINIKEAYPANADSPSLAYTTGSFRNDSTPESEDGTPLEKGWANDLLGARDAILKRANITPSGDVETAEVSDVLDALEFIIEDLAPSPSPFESKPIGEPFPLWTHITGVSEPSNAGDSKFIKLSASDAYNTGLLISESVSGSSPNIEATAIIDYAESLLNGQTVTLINTSRQFIRPGSSGAEQSSQNIAHTHTYPFRATLNEGSTSAPSGGGSGSNTGTTNSSGSDESRPRNIGATYYMRIA